MENKYFKIIKIIDDYRVVINAGKNYDIQLNQEYEIFFKGAELKDDDTGESYGTLDFIKGIVKIVDVFDKVSVCENVETFSKTEPSPMAKVLMAATSPLGLVGETKIYVKPLNVDQGQITGYGFDIDKKISVGDLVRER